ncbi:response regulator [Rubrivirga sp.]|uniref:response regulator n=1 Tax=Rubrivirga sp. TaxID=1885344 RepID=UPI003C71F9F9
MSIRVFVVEDHHVVREGYVALLGTVPEVELVGVAERGEEAIDRIPPLRCDVVAVDLQLPGMSGLEVVKRLVALEDAPSILVVSAHEEAIYADHAFEAGATGYLTKHEAARQLPDAVLMTANGERYLSESLRAQA